MKPHSKIIYSFIGLNVGALLLLAAGCGKQEQPAGSAAKSETPAASENAQPAAAPKPAVSTTTAATPAGEPAPASATPQPASSAISAAEQAKTTAATTAQQMAAAATNQASTSVAAANSQVQALIEKAKGLVTDEKYKDALTVVQQLSNLRLTPEQRSLVDGLKTQIQAALAKDATSNAASALGNVLGGKK